MSPDSGFSSRSGEGSTQDNEAGGRAPQRPACPCNACAATGGDTVAALLGRVMWLVALIVVVALASAVAVQL